MKIVNLLFLTLLLCVSCGSDDDEMEKIGNCLNAEINGTEFVAETTTGIFTDIEIDYENLGVQQTKLLTITGVIPSLTGETKTVTLVFACSELSSTLDYVDTDADCGIGLNYSITNFIDPNSSIAIPATTGIINIQEVSDTQIKGTFHFSGEDQNGTAYEITNGFFDTSIIM